MSIRGKQRAEYIQRWLQGEEDPEVEVIPTKAEGRYIVRRRETAPQEATTTTENDNPSQPLVNPPPPSVSDPSDEYEYYSESEYEEEEPKPVTKKSKRGRDIQLEILNQLRILGEDTLRKREKKERKKETKHIVRKELSRHYPIEYSDDESSGFENRYEPRRIVSSGILDNRLVSSGILDNRLVYQAPRYQRRRLNLLSDYR